MESILVYIITLPFRVLALSLMLTIGAPLLGLLMIGRHLRRSRISEGLNSDIDRVLNEYRKNLFSVFAI